MRINTSTLHNAAQSVGIENAAQLAAKAKIGLTSAYQLWNGTAKGVQFDTLNAVCNVVQAGPGVLLEYIPDVDSSRMPAPAQSEAGSNAKRLRPTSKQPKTKSRDS